jgi:poly(A) polymerase
MREIWMMQPRFEKRSGTTPFSLAEQPRFRAGFDFLRLRADVGEIDEVQADWWQAFSLADDGVRESLVRELRIEQQRNKKPPARVHRMPKPAAALDGKAPDAAESVADDTGDDVGDGPSAPAKKRRRRRRKPSGGGGAPAAPASDAHD